MTDRDKRVDEAGQAAEMDGMDQAALERAQNHEVCTESCPGHGWRVDDDGSES